MSSTFDSLVDEIVQTLQGYGLSQPRAAFIAGSGITNSDLTITVDDAAGFEQGVAEIGNETLFIKSVDYGSNVLTLSADGRGYYGTTAAAHAVGARVTMAPTWPRAQVAQVVNQAISGTYPTLFAVGTATFTFSPSINTYSLPEGVSRILRVTCDTIGSTREQLTMHRYSFNSVAPVGEFATGNTITLEQSAYPGRSVNVTYKGVPTEITFGDSFTDCGLRESARYAVKLSACSNLIGFMDSARLPVGIAEADEYDPSRNGVGTAARLSAQLYQRYLVELDSERKRLLEATPPSVSVRTR